MENKLYKKNNTQKLDMELFKNPTSEYRGTPFWSWNCKLEENMLRRQINALREMGFGGFHMHSRTGMATPYLSDEFMHMVSACVDEAKKNDMLAWLYDEDRYSSGQAGGLALKDSRFRMRYAELTPVRIDGFDKVDPETQYKNGKGWFLAAYDVELTSDNLLKSYKRIGFDDEAKHLKLYAYTHSVRDEGWYNGKCHIDTLSKEAMDEFVRITYDAYKNTCADEYGKCVPAMFTDEPLVYNFNRLNFRNHIGHCAWTYTLSDEYTKKHNCDILDTFPEIFIDLENNAPSKARYRYFDHIAEMFSAAFLDNCADRCTQDGLLFTGHLMGEHCFEDALRFVSDPIRPYRKMQLPGVDLLCNKFEFETLLQCRTAVRQYGREGMLSELYGVTNYNFDFRGHKFQGDWQAAMGVTVRVPHLSWLSMEGNAKRDYPATINYQAPWYKEYKYVEDHFARLNTVLTRGKPVCNIAVVNPIESYWIDYGPDETSAARRKKYDTSNYGGRKLTDILLLNHLDFDYISESLLPEQSVEVGRQLKIGEMAYDTVIVHNSKTLRKTTVDTLNRFVKAGGRVLFIGEPPKYVDLEECECLTKLISESEQIFFDENTICEALAGERKVSITLPNGVTCPNKIYQLRKDSDVYYLFVANLDRRYLDGLTSSDLLTFTVKGEFKPVLLDTLTGCETPLEFEIKAGCTVFKYPFYTNTSMLVKLAKPEISGDFKLPAAKGRIPDYSIDFKDVVNYALTDLNALILDRAEFAVDGGDYLPEEEILRLDNISRNMTGLDKRSNHVPQPWCVAPEVPTHFIDLRFTFDSEINYPGAKLAVERPETMTIRFNGKTIDTSIIPDEYYVDESIKVLEIGCVEEGKNTLEIRLPLGTRTNTEWCYILGNFGVKLLGCKKIITNLPDTLAFGSTLDQGLPFYGHSVIYKTEISLKKASDICINVRRFTSQLIRVYVDGKDCGIIAYAPYKLCVSDLEAGKHTVEFKAYGSLVNTFGPIHYCGTHTWIGPDKWFTTGDDFTYEYNLHPFGILSSPEIEVFEK